MTKRRTLADAFGVDVDELGAGDSWTPPEDSGPVLDDSIVVDSELPAPSEDGLIHVGKMAFLQQGDNLVPVSATVQLNLSLSALEKHRLQQFCKENRMSMVEAVRTGLELLYGDTRTG